MKRFTRWIACGLSLVMVLLLLPWTVPVSAEVQYSGQWSNFSWSLDEDGTMTVTGEGEMLMDPNDTDKGSWRPYLHLVKKLIIGEGVKSIGEAMFMGAANMTEVQLPESLSFIRAQAFMHCSSLRSIVIPKGAASIGHHAFMGCYRLVEIYNFSGESIGEHYAIYVYGQSMNVRVKQWTDENGFRFFEYGDKCYLIDYLGDQSIITLPESCDGKDYHIYDYAFYGRNHIVQMTIPEGVLGIGEQAFDANSNLVGITLPASLQYIESRALLGCSKLMEVYNLSALPIEKGSESYGGVGYYALTIHTQSDIPSLLHTTEDGYIFYENGDEVYLAGYLGTDTVLRLPENYHGKSYGIYNGAFLRHRDLTEVFIPAAVTSIGQQAFHVCKQLKQVTIAENSQLKKIGDGAFMECESLEAFAFPQGLTEIEASAFYECPKLTRVDLPDSLTSLGTNAFERCTGLTELRIPDSLTEIPSSAFSGCDALTRIEVPEGITKIGLSAFASCDSLTYLKLPETLKKVESGAFNGCYQLEQVDYGGTPAKWNKILFGSADNCLKGAKRTYACMGHKWDRGTVTIEPTKREEGEIVYSCSACGKKQVQTLDRLPRYTKEDIAFMHRHLPDWLVDYFVSLG